MYAPSIGWTWIHRIVVYELFAQGANKYDRINSI